MDPSMISQSAHDNRTAAQHLSNLECALLSKAEPVNKETKLFAVRVVREKVGSLVGCDAEFSEIEAIVRIAGNDTARLTYLMDVLKATAASLTG